MHASPSSISTAILRNRNRQPRYSRQSYLFARSESCAKVLTGAEKHHGFGDSDNWRNSRAHSQDRGFFHGEHEIAQRGPFLAGRVGTPERVCRFQLPVRQPDTVCHPHLAMRVAGLEPVQLEPIMAKTLALCASSRTTSSTTGNPGNLPALPAFTAFGHIIRDRVAIASNKLKMQPVDNSIARQQAIENALSTALWHVRNGTGPLSIQAATGRAIRAASMLKQACAESTIGGVAA